MREALVADTTDTLREADFAVSDRCDIRPKSFDVVARRDRLVLLVKVLDNIDGLTVETAEEMKALSQHLDAPSVLVGRKSSDRPLEDGVLYLRYGVPAMNLVSLREFLVESVPPFAYMARGGLYVNLDGDVLERRRRAEELSLGQVANELGVSRRSVSKYESGMDATLDIAMALEDLFEEPLIAPVEPFDRIDGPEEPLEDREQTDTQDPFGDLVAAGFEVLLTQRAPFRAVSEDEQNEASETVLTGSSRHDADVEKRARLMSSIAEVTGTRSVYLLEEAPRRETIAETVLLGIEELEDVGGADEFDEKYREKLT